MDAILKSLLAFEKVTDAIKRKIITEKVLTLADRPIEVSDCRRLLDLSWDLAVNALKPFDKDMGLQVFCAWIPHNKGILTEWFSKDKLPDLLNDKYLNTDKTSLFQILMFLLDNLDATSGSYDSSLTAVSQYVNSALDDPVSLDALLAASILLRKCPRGLTTRECALKALKNLSLLVDVTPPVVANLKLKAETLCQNLKYILADDPSSMAAALDVLLQMLLSENLPSSTTLAAFVEVLDLEPNEISRHCNRALNSLSDNGQLERVVCRMVSWILWPDTHSCHKWILLFFDSCIRKNRGAVLRATLQIYMQDVLCALQISNTRHCAFLVFQFIVLSCLRDPGLVKQIVIQLSKLIAKIKEEPDADLTFVTSLENLLNKAQTQMHTGFPVRSKEHDELQAILRNQKLQAGGSNIQPATANLLNSLLRKSSSPPVGLDNLGNTCYINSVVQALNMTHGFRCRILERSIERGQRLLPRLQEVMAFLLLTQRPAYSPETFVEIARPTWFIPGEQQDSQEFLNHLFSVLEEEDNEKVTKQVPLVRNIFGGTTQTRTTCARCKRTSIVNDTFYNLLLPLSRNESETDENSSELTLENILSSYFKPELLEGGNKYKCDICDNLEDAERAFCIASAPHHLILTLLRFEYEGNRRRKISVPVRFPKSLQLPTEVDGVVEYLLFAAVIHAGVSAEKGHYYTYAKCSVPNARVNSEKWFLFNDESVCESSFENLQSVSTKQSRETVYMLFYCRVSEVTCTNSVYTLVSQSLREKVMFDNLTFAKEEKLKSGSKRRLPAENKDRKDDDLPPPGTGGCGLGGGFGSFDSSSRVVF